MSDPLIRETDYYVILETGKEEKILNSFETLSWLESRLEQLEDLPKDLEKFNSKQAAAQYLLDTACALEMNPGINIEWYAIRLHREEKQK